MFDQSVEPLIHFTRLLDEAKRRGVPEHNAMALATAGADLKPSVRIVYFKGLIRGGLSFYTNYDSEKATNLAQNNWACANFYYPTRWEQIRVTGRAEKLTPAENEDYFKSRARLSQLGAWASQQSSKIPDREFFQLKLEEFEKSFEGQDVPCPNNWGGYRIVPEEFEFWFGKDGRLHERFIYTRDARAEGGWQTSMKSP